MNIRVKFRDGIQNSAILLYIIGYFSLVAPSDIYRSAFRGQCRLMLTQNIGSGVELIHCSKMASDLLWNG